jgi:tRNA(fMet)-specific endonuclease VapC
LLDTSVCVSLIHGRAVLKNLPRPDECVVSVITAAELEVGICRCERPGEQRRILEAFLALFRVIPLELSAVRHYGEIRTQPEKLGMCIGPLDLLIAAQARSLAATVLTANIKESKRVPGLSSIAW